MNVAGLAPSSLLALSALVKTGVSAAAELFSPDESPANSAASATPQQSILPSASGLLQLSMDALLSLQSADPKSSEIQDMSAADKFLAEAQKTPMQRMREQVLDSLGLSEGALAQMSPEQRRAAENNIRELIEEKLRQAMNVDPQSPDSNAAMLQTLA